jgi:Sigma-70, region 4
MDPQHPNHRGERGLRALTSSPVVRAPPSRHRRPAVLGTPALTATRSTIGSCYEPGHAIRDGADANPAAVRITRQEWRRRWQRSPEIVTGPLPEQLTGNASEQVVSRHLVAAALGRLTQEHRDVLRECCFLGSSVAQAAHALGIAPGTVKSRTYYALRALRLAIEELRDAE